MNSTCLEIHTGGRRRNLLSLNRDNSAADCPIALKFGVWMHYGCAEVAEVLKMKANALWTSEQQARRRAPSSCNALQLQPFLVFSVTAALLD